MQNEALIGLKLENQVCFPLYACSKEIIRRYKPHLDKLDLTYTQYIAMLVLWEKKSLNVKTLGDALLLDSGTLTPLLKKLEAKGYLTRKRSFEDERTLIVTLTEKGEQLKEQAAGIPAKVSKNIGFSADEGEELYRLLNKLLVCLEEKE